MEHLFKILILRSFLSVLLVFFSIVTCEGNSSGIKNVYSDSVSFNENKKLIYKEVLSNVKHLNDSLFLKAIKSFPTEAKSLYYLQLGKWNYLNKRYDTALWYLNAAAELYSEANNFDGLADVHFYLGKVYLKQNNPEEFLQNLNRAISFYKLIENWDNYCLTYGEVGNYFSKNRNQSNAEEYYNRAKSVFSSVKSKAVKDLVIFNFANHLNTFKEYDEALKYYLLLSETTNVSSHRYGDLLNNIGTIYLNQRKLDEAQIYLIKALEHKKMKGDSIEIATTLQNLFRVALLRRDISLSKKYYADLNKLMDEFEVPETLLLEFSFNRVRYYSMISDGESSINEFENYNILKDSLVNAAFSDKLIEMQKSFELKEKDQEIALLQKEDALNQARLKTKNVLIAVIGSFLLILILVGYLINRQRKELAQSRRRLLRQKEDISGMNDQLRVSNLAKDRILSVIGHDLRGPVGGLKELIELYMELPEYEPNDIKNLLKTARESSTSTYHLLENLLSWANSQRGDIVFNPVATPLAPLIKQSVQLLDRSINVRNVRFEYDIPQALVIQVDMNMLRTIIRNLVSNALKYSPDNGLIKIMVLKEANQVKFCICDQGKGMTADETQNIFKKKETYFIGSELTAKGTGLGLILCKEFVERHGGSIWINSEEGVGTQVWFSILQKGVSTTKVNELQSSTAQ